VKTTLEGCLVKVYNNLFVGIPLPEKYLEEYGSILESINKVDKSIRTSKTRYPHITILFMGKQNGNVAQEVVNFARENKAALQDCLIRISKINCFFNQRYDVLYLKIDGTAKLKEFFDVLVEKFRSNFISEKRNFDPHLTLGRIKTRGRRSQEILDKVRNTIPPIKWEFKIQYLNIYGRDPEEKNKQIVLGNIKIN